MYNPSMKAKMDTLEEERARLEAKLLAIPEPEPVVLHPGLAGIYAGKVSKLAEALNEDCTWAEAADLLRGLIEKVIGRSRPRADNPLCLTPRSGNPKSGRLSTVKRDQRHLAAAQDKESFFENGRDLPMQIGKQKTSLTANPCPAASIPHCAQRPRMPDADKHRKLKIGTGAVSIYAAPQKQEIVWRSF
jgi:hypothetical protein